MPGMKADPSSQLCVLRPLPRFLLLRLTPHSSCNVDPSPISPFVDVVVSIFPLKRSLNFQLFSMVQRSGVQHPLRDPPCPFDRFSSLDEINLDTLLKTWFSVSGRVCMKLFLEISIGSLDWHSRNLEGFFGVECSGLGVFFRLEALAVPAFLVGLSESRLGVFIAVRTCCGRSRGRVGSKPLDRRFYVSNLTKPFSPEFDQSCHHFVPGP